MKKYKLKIQGNQYDVEILGIEENIAEVDVNGTIYKVEVDKNLKPVTKTPILVRSQAVPASDFDKAIIKTATPTSPKGTGTIKSPLPGVVLNVMVREGDPVKYGDKLLVLEAMKMENTIEADKEGIVKSLKVKQGDSVLEGDILIEIGS